MDFALSTEQQLLIDSVRAFVEQELYPYEDEVEKTDAVRPELLQQIKERALAQGFILHQPEDAVEVADHLRDRRLEGKVKQDDARILDVHVAYLKDSVFISDVENLILNEQLSLEAAIAKA